MSTSPAVSQCQHGSLCALETITRSCFWLTVFSDKPALNRCTIYFVSDSVGCDKPASPSGVLCQRKHKAALSFAYIDSKRACTPVAFIRIHFLIECNAFYLDLVQTAFISYHWEIILAKSGFIFSTGKHGFFFFLTCYFLLMASKIHHKNTLTTDLKTNNLQIIIISLQNTREESRHQMSVR